MSKFINIVKGHAHNIARSNPQVESVSAQRMQVCRSCPFITKIYGFEQCRLCGCPLQAKTRVLQEQCPSRKW